MTLTLQRRLPVTRPCLIVGCLMGALALAGAAHAQERQAVPGTTVSLVPMPGFVPATGFAGFANEKVQGSVVIAELPAVAFTEVSALFGNLDTARAQFAKQRVTVTAREELDTPAGKIPLIVGTQDNAGTTYGKWVALFKGSRTVLITVQSPQSAPLDAAAVKAMLATVTLGAEPSITDKLKSLPFIVEPRAPFRVIDTMGGSGVLMTVGDRDVDPSGTQPVLIVAYQLSAPLKPEQLDVAAEQLLKQTKDFAAAQIDKRERTPFAGATGLLLGGTHLQNGATNRFAQYMTIGESGRFIRLVVSANEKGFADLQPAIAGIAQSIAFKPSSTPK